MKDSFDVRVARLAERQHALITLRQVISINGTPRMAYERVASHRWRRVDHEVFAIAGSPNTWRQQILASTLAVGDGSRVAGHSAASLLRLPGFREGPVEVLVLRPCQSGSMLGMVRQTKLLPATHCTSVDNIPVTAVPRTIFDLAATLRPDRTERVLDHVLAYGLAPLERFWDVFMDLAQRGRAGTVVMRGLLLARGPGYIAPASELEALFLELVRRYGLPVPDQQIAFGDRDGLIGRVDFRMPNSTLLVETDGRRYHSALLDLANDRERDRRLGAMGLTVLRVTWKDITEQPDECAARIRGQLLALAA